MSNPRRHPSDPAQRGTYEVGRGKPPKHSRFKPGRSGNPKGRPRSRQNIRTILEEALSEKISVREGGRVRRVSSLDALIRTTLRGAINGNAKAFTSLVALMRAAGLLTEHSAGEASPELSADESKLLADFLARNSGRAATHEPSEPSSRSSRADAPHGGKTGQ